VAGVLLVVIAFLSSRNLTREAFRPRTLDAGAVVHKIQHLDELLSVIHGTEAGGPRKTEVSLRIREAASVRASRSVGRYDLSSMMPDVKLLPLSDCGSCYLAQNRSHRDRR
jgi:hypothetical protein